MFRKLAAIVGVALIAVTLTGCFSTVDEDGTNKNIAAHTVTFSTGDTVNCLVYSGPVKGGVECDWENLGASDYEPTIDLIGTVETIGEKTVLCVSYDKPKAGGLTCNF